ncbi:helix-turn-helix domain-containing protein [Ureibacillus massiliensis]|uniref:PucR family transcriptional regulator n=1 Tax=Ureibacillus massiliensis TaxID=292806 RepID=UPI000A0039AC
MGFFRSLKELPNVKKIIQNTERLNYFHRKNHKETAKELHIHGNTLYYRLKKIEEILKIDLNNEKEWVDIVIATQLYVASHKNY